MTKTLAAWPFLRLLLHTGPASVFETQWLGFAGSADFRAALLEVVQLAQQYRVAGWVADDRKLGAVRPKDLEWTHTHVLKPLDELGVRRFAQLESNEALNRLTISGMYQMALPDLRYKFRHFTDLDEARAWAAGHPDQRASAH